MDDLPHFITAGSGDETIHFSGGNGFAPATYRQFLERLGRQYAIIALNTRPLWSAADPWETLTDWHPFADDMIAFLDERAAAPVVGIGHSLGAVVTMLAAAKRPDLFSKLVVIDPPVQTPEIFAKWVGMRAQIDPRTIPMAARALRRQDRWGSRAEAFAYFRGKSFFDKWSDELLNDYVTHGLVDDGDGVRLLFSTNWEGWIFSTIPFDVWDRLAEIEMPILAVRGGETDVLSAGAWQHWQQMVNAHTTFRELPNVGHMLPFETPQLTADTILDYLTTHP